jgi:peroxiredoxin
MHTILLLAFLQAPAAREPLRSGCSADDQQIAMVSAADSVQVQMALAGEEPRTCYKVILNRPGENLTGYVLGESLPAIAAFVRLREQESREATEAQARRALAPAGAKNGDQEAKTADPNLPSHFDDFAWRDLQGKAGSLSGLGGRVTLVTFWPPNSPRSRDELNRIQPLYSELRRSGLAAVGVSMDSNPKRMYEVLDDTNFNWPQVPDRDGLAARYHVNPKAGETFVLDASHRVVAAGPMGPQIEKAVRQLLAAPEH